MAATENAEAGDLYGIQYHPEVLHTVEGTKMLKNFVLVFADVPETGEWNSFRGRKVYC